MLCGFHRPARAGARDRNRPNVVFTLADELAGRPPAKAEQMRRMLELWRYDVAAQTTSANLDYGPKKARRSK
jgi:hypothetical protein